MKISVITCCWNSEPFIAECIASVQAQSHQDWEQVFVDGGSTDGTLERIQTLAANDARVRWLTDVRGGISNAMNVGAELGHGDVLIHLHADDYLAGPEVLAQVATHFRDPAVTWVFGRMDADIDGQRETPSWAMPPYSYSRLLRGNFIMHPSVFMRREIFLAAGGFDTSLKYAMDYDYWLRVARLRAPRPIELTTSVFRRHAGSVSTANAFKAFVEDHEVRRRHVGRNPFAQLYHELIFKYRVWRRWRGHA